MAQGIYTAAAMILAEELDADYANVSLVHARPSDELHGNPTFGRGSGTRSLTSAYLISPSSLSARRFGTEVQCAIWSCFLPGPLRATDRA